MSETTDDTSIRASIEAAFGSMEEKATEPVTPEPAVQIETEPAVEVDTDGQPRDEHGRFAPKQQQATQDTPPPEQPEAEQQPKADQQATDAPAHWRPADKEMFGKLPPEGRDFLLRRHKEMEADYTHKTSEIAAFRRDYGPIRQMFEPHAAALREKGMTPAALVQGWYNAETALMNPQSAPQMVAQIMRGYNIDPATVLAQFGYRPGNQDGTPPEPTQQAATPALPPELQQMLQGVVQKVESFEQQQRRQQEAAQAAAAARVQSEIDNFASAVGPDGQPLRPFFREVEDMMADLAEVARKKGADIPPLQSLYEQAVYAHPVVRQRFLDDQAAAASAQRAAQERQRAEEARARAAKAQRASAPVTGAPGTGHGDHRATGELSLREQLAQAADSAFGTR